MANTLEKENIFIRILKYLIPWKGDKPTEIIRKVVFLAALITLIVSVTNLILAQVNRITDNSLNKEITELYHGTAASKVEINTESREEIIKENPEILEKFIPLKEINEDIVSCIIDGIANCGKRFMKIAFVGVRNRADCRAFRVIHDKNGCAVSFFEDYEKAKEWVLPVSQ